MCLQSMKSLMWIRDTVLVVDQSRFLLVTEFEVKVPQRS